MIAALLVAAALPSYAALTDEGRRLSIAVRDGRVTRIKTTIERYECKAFGDVGPLRISVTPRARVARGGRFSVVTGPGNERVGIAGTLHGDGTATGRVRVSGTIGTGERCASRTIRFR